MLTHSWCSSVHVHLIAVSRCNPKPCSPLFCRLSSNFFPWGGKYKLEDLPTYDGIKEALARAGAVARATGQRVTAHPSEFVKLAAPRPELVEESLADLELHGSVRVARVANISSVQVDVAVTPCHAVQVGT